MNLAQHAQQPMQQRGIYKQAVNYVLAYGRVSHDHHGGCVLWMDKLSRARLGRDEGQQVLRELDKHLNAYVVTDTGGMVVTAGHRYRRIMRH